MDTVEDLRSFMRGEVTADAAARAAASHDASLFEVMPELVVSPADSADLQALVAYVASHGDRKLSLTARSGGTCMSGGPLTSSIVVDMKGHFTHIKAITGEQAVVEPGVFYRDFEKATLAKNRLMPSFPASREICTVGGMVANNSGGEKTLQYGKTEKYVARLKVILSDGKEYVIEPLTPAELDAKCALQTFEGGLYRRIRKLLEDNKEIIAQAKPKVSKNSAGYNLWNIWNGRTFDLTQLFVGSQGTLGLITEITFRLVEPQPHSQMLVILLRDLAPLARLTKTVLTYHPESFESYDNQTLKLALRFLPEIAKRLPIHNIFSLAWQFLPEAQMVLHGGLPKLILLAEFTGRDQAEVSGRAKAAQAALRPFGLSTRLTASESEATKYWTIRRESFNLLRQHIHGKRTAPFIDDIVVNPQYLPEFLPKLNEIMGQYNLLYTIAGHVGDGNFHIIPLMDLRDPKSREIISKLSQEVYKLVLEFHGSMTGEHNDGLIRSPFLEDMFGPQVYHLFEETKKIFDPNNIFNPGKKVGASWDYAMEHLVKS
jgi:FAD/FMN-containing dehydrogenase